MRNSKKVVRLWKFLTLDDDGKTPCSDHDGSEWKPKAWRNVFKEENDTREEGMIETCGYGFHASPSIAQAWEYVSSDILALVEARGYRADDDDKSAHEEMRIVEAWKIDCNDSDLEDAIVDATDHKSSLQFVKKHLKGNKLWKPKRKKAVKKAKKVTKKHR